MSRFLRLPISLSSLPILIVAGFLGGAVMALQMTRALAQWGQAGLLSAAVSTTVMRELGPVLTGLIVAGRFAFGIGREQRAQKGPRMMPRLIATIVSLPLLTLITSVSGITGGWLVNALVAPWHPYWGPMSTSLEWSDLVHCLSTTFIFQISILLIGCYYSLRATSRMRPNVLPPAGITG
jgi:phospholipid/cholesterol/gamma-HCH transport system permease protein